MSDYFQVFFHTKKGGKGIDYETAKAEFLSVFRYYKKDILRELPFKMRMHIKIDDISIEKLAELASKLGYTYGILHAHEEPYLGEELKAKNTARWVVGTIRIRDSKLHLEEVYRQDKKALRQSAPNERTFLVDKDGEIKPIKGQRRKRGVSPNDTKFILNIAELDGNEIILDPFAGIGGLILESISRGFRAFASDIDPMVRPGLAQVTNNRCILSDARYLPFKNDFFDAIITEPPFNTRYRQSVLDSLPELCRVIKPCGKVVLFIAQDMHDEISAYMIGFGFIMKKDFIIRRHGGLTSRVLVFQKPKMEEK